VIAVEQGQVCAVRSLPVLKTAVLESGRNLWSLCEKVMSRISVPQKYHNPFFGCVVSRRPLAEFIGVGRKVGERDRTGRKTWEGWKESVGKNDRPIVPMVCLIVFRHPHYALTQASLSKARGALIAGDCHTVRQEKIMQSYSHLCIPSSVILPTYYGTWWRELLRLLSVWM